MFAVIDVSGTQSSYVPGSFRDRKVPKVSRMSAIGSTERQYSSPGQSSLEEPAPFKARVYEQVKELSRATSSTIIAREMMASPVTTLPLHSSLADAWEVVKNARFRHIPIQSRKGELVGILSDRDLSRATVEAAMVGPKGKIDLGRITIESYVRHPVLVASPDASLLAVARVLLEERIGAIPIVSREQELVGMITRSDVLRVIVSHPHFEQWG